MGFRYITSRDKRETIARHEAKHEQRLKRALAIAVSRATRGNDIITRLLRSATVQGRVEDQNIKAGLVSFDAPPFGGGSISSGLGICWTNSQNRNWHLRSPEN